MASSRAVLTLLSLVAIACVVLGGGAAEANLTCNQVVRYLMPCVPYVVNGGTVPTECCSGIKNLNDQATTAGDRQGVCTCLKNVINGYSYNSKNVALAAGLPRKCGVSLPYKISPSTDCKSVK